MFASGLRVVSAHLNAVITVLFPEDFNTLPAPHTITTNATTKKNAACLLHN